jgi:hypothetical protein
VILDTDLLLRREANLVQVPRIPPAHLLVIVMLLGSNLFLPMGLFKPDQTSCTSTVHCAVSMVKARRCSRPV